MFLNIFLLALTVATRAGANTINRYPLQEVIENDAEKIIGGTEAIPHAWPWQIEMRTSSGFFICGGSILSERWIMTAAHCCKANGNSPSAYRVRVGVHKRSATDEGAVLMTLSRIVVHPKYNPNKFDSDYCLMQTSTAISMNTKVAAIALPTSSDGPVGKQCWTTGWGLTKGGGSTSDKLLQVDVNIMSNTACDAIYEIITNNMVCATLPGHGVCNGDSGGPLVCQEDAEPYKLIGITSFGESRCTNAGVFARTSSVLSWITSTMGTE